jgi:hypothetical protein
MPRQIRSLASIDRALVRVAKKLTPKSGKRMTRGELEAVLAAVEVLSRAVCRLRGDAPTRELGFDTVGGDSVDVETNDDEDVDHGLDVDFDKGSDETEYRATRRIAPRGRIGF